MPNSYHSPFHIIFMPFLLIWKPTIRLLFTPPNTASAAACSSPTSHRHALQHCTAPRRTSGWTRSATAGIAKRTRTDSSAAWWTPRASGSTRASPRTARTTTSASSRSASRSCSACGSRTASWQGRSRGSASTRLSIWCWICFPSLILFLVYQQLYSLTFLKNTSFQLFQFIHVSSVHFYHYISK